MQQHPAAALLRPHTPAHPVVCSTAGQRLQAAAGPSGLPAPVLEWMGRLYLCGWVVREHVHKAGGLCECYRTRDAPNPPRPTWHSSMRNVGTRIRGRLGTATPLVPSLLAHPRISLACPALHHECKHAPQGVCAHGPVCTHTSAEGYVPIPTCLSRPRCVRLVCCLPCCTPCVNTHLACMHFACTQLACMHPSCTHTLRLLPVSQPLLQVAQHDHQPCCCTGSCTTLVLMQPCMHAPRLPTNTASLSTPHGPL